MSNSVPTSTEHYTVLGIRPDASLSDIRSAYRTAALRYHPDKNKTPGAVKAFQQVATAYQVLTSQDDKYCYDRAFKISCQVITQPSPFKVFEDFFGSNDISEVSPPLYVGCRVQLTGMKDAKWEKCVGLCVSWSAQTQRWNVLIQTSNETIAVKPNNLQPSDSAEVDLQPIPRPHCHQITGVAQQVGSGQNVAARSSRQPTSLQSQSMLGSVVDSAVAWVQGSRAGDAHTVPDLRTLLLGATGGGKTAFLNLICNFAHVDSLGVADVDAFNDVNKLELENSNSKMESQTCDATVYRTRLSQHLVEIIDTPGMIDTRGPQQDKEHMQKIIDVINRVGSLNCIVIVANGAAARMDPALECALLTIAGIMPSKALPQLYVVYTHVDSLLKLTFGHSEMEKALNVKDIPFGVIDNPYSLLQNAKRLQSSVPAAEVALELQAIFVKTSTQLQKFLALLEESKPTSTVQFKQLYDMKIHIETTTLSLMTQMGQVAEKRKHFANQMLQLDKAVSSKAACKDFSEVQIIDKCILEPTDRHNTLCSFPNCFCNCHEPCNLMFNADASNKEAFKQCAAMGCGGDTCTKCTHSFDKHYHINSRWVWKKESYTSVDKDMKGKYDKAVTEADKFQVLKAKAQQNMLDTERKQQELSDNLLKNILQFEAYSNARNYAGMLKSQIRLLETWIMAKDGLVESEQMVRDMVKTKSQLEEALKVISKVVSNVGDCGQEQQQFCPPQRAAGFGGRGSQQPSGRGGLFSWF